MTDRVAEKICFKCGKLKPLTDFYKHEKMSDGHVNKCKECNKKDVKKNYRENIDHYTEYEKNRFQDKDRKEYVTEQQREHRAKNPLKYKARTAVNNAIRDGRLFKQPCQYCGSEEKIQGHHHDYSKPLDVIWVCFQCHRQKEHNQLNYLD